MPDWFRCRTTLGDPGAVSGGKKKSKHTSKKNRGRKVKNERKRILQDKMGVSLAPARSAGCPRDEWVRLGHHTRLSLFGLSRFCSKKAKT